MGVGVKRRAVAMCGVVAALVLLAGSGLVGAATTSQSVTCSISASKLTCPLPPPVKVTVAGPTVTVTVTQSGTPASSGSSPSPSSSTPTPSPSQPVTGCLPVPSACGYPDASNTGTTGPLTVWNGDYHTSSNGQTVTGLDIRGTLYIDNSNVTVRNVQVVQSNRAAWGITIGAKATAGNPLTGIAISDCTVDAGRSDQGGVSAPEGYVSWTMTRCDISNGENGIRPAGQATITDTYVHDLASASSAPHYDAVEVYAGDQTVFQHDTLICQVAGQYTGTGITSAFNVQGDFQAVTNTVLDGSLLDGGGYTANIRGIGANPVRDTTVSSNRFGPHHAYGYSADDATNTTATGNVADATGKNIDSQI